MGDLFISLNHTHITGGALSQYGKCCLLHVVLGPRTRTLTEWRTSHLGRRISFEYLIEELNILDLLYLLKTFL